ncbi:MAG: hypothetical protein SP4CHLAM5_08930 [Chlamydiia bacterium]|nr:hypothetical protein [Chlamydiia bacterium]MCH9618756.1 hypothetical protein [Chlamydiia bacterium]MCH9624443.1 hypothetical protein [Chlamydiia bacterium]
MLKETLIMAISHPTKAIDRQLSAFEMAVNEFKKPTKELTAQERLFAEGKGGFEKYFNKQELKNFYSNLCWFISQEMDKLKADAKKANERLKRSQEGKEQDDE